MTSRMITILIAMVYDAQLRPIIMSIPAHVAIPIRGVTFAMDFQSSCHFKCIWPFPPGESMHVATFSGGPVSRGNQITCPCRKISLITSPCGS